MKVWYTVFADGDGEGKGTGEGAGEGAGAGAGAATTLTQDQVNKILAEDRRKHQQKYQKAIEELEALKAKATLTSDERQELDARLAEMQNSLLTKEELARKEQEKLKKEHEGVAKALTVERDGWKNRYEDSTIVRSITDAAVANKAFAPKQIVALLKPNTRLVEELDEAGKPTGEFSTKVKFTDIGKDGKPVTLDLTVGEAIKRMNELEEYHSLFRDDSVSGLGRSAGNGTALDVTKIAKDPKAYREARKAGRI